MRTSFDFSPFRQSSVGFDRLFDMLESGSASATSDGYPPFDLEQDDENHYRITLAVAGFSQNEIEITSHQNVLLISGRKGEDNERQYIHRGIATRAFERRFALGAHVRVQSAEMRDGLLRIELVREVPEEVKPRRIEIGGASAPQQVTENTDANNDNKSATAAA
jgi:molecular chaperone IbpA